VYDVLPQDPDTPFNREEVRTVQTYLRICDVLQRPVFRGAQLVAGQAGVKRPVRWVHILDVPDAREHIHGGELVLSTGLGFGDQLSRFRAFLQELIEGEAAGLCIELGTVVREIPPEILELAENASFPLVVFPMRVRFVDITQDIHKQILLHERRAFFEQDWVEQQIRGTGLVSTPAIPACNRTDAGRLYRVAVIAIPDERNQVSRPAGYAEGATRDWFDRKTDLSLHVRTAFTRQGIRPYLSVRMDTVIAILEMKDEHTLWASRLGQAFNALKEVLVRANWEMNIRMGVGREVRSICDVPRSYEDALTALSVCQRLQVGEWLSYEDTGIFRWISLLAEQAQAAAYASHDLQAVLEFDRKHHTNLFETLKVYLDCDRSKQRTADTLFIHRQTLYHRLEQLSQVLHIDLDDPVQRLSLHLSIYYYSFLKSTGSQGLSQ
jgi:hypothetical protein